MKSEENIKAVDLLRLLMSTSIGHRGSSKLIRNDCGGHVTITTNSYRFLKSIRISNPIIKVLSSAAVDHLSQRANDGGSWFLLLASRFMLNLWRLSEEIPLNIVQNIYEEVGKYLIRHLDNCSRKIKVNFECLQTLMSVVKSILSSKPGCQLTKTTSQHLSSLLLKSFLGGISSDDNQAFLGILHYVPVCGVDPSASQLYPGLLLVADDFEWSHVVHTLINEQNLPVLKVVLFRVSLSGDAQLQDVEWSVNVNVNPVKAFTEKIMSLCAEIVRNEVKIMGCQKVIHSRVKKYLNANGVITFDRLGQVKFNAFLQLTGCTPLESFVQPFEDSCIGFINSISIITQHNKQFCHLENETGRINTLLLCNHHEESVEELEVVCRQGIDTLRALLHSPYVLHGGGCFEMYLVAHIKEISESIFSQSRIECSKSQVSLVLEAVADAFQHVALDLHKTSKSEVSVYEQKEQHLWVEAGSCACGAIYGSSDPENSRKPVILDAFWIKFNGLKSVLEVVGTLLRVDDIIH